MNENEVKVNGILVKDFILVELGTAAATKELFALYASICEIESNFKVDARRYERGLDKPSVNDKDNPYKDDKLNEDDASYGLFQLLYTTAVDIGFKGNQKDLFDYKNNIKYGIKYINICKKYADKYINKYGIKLDYKKVSENFYPTIIVYNEGMGNFKKLAKLLSGKVIDGDVLKNNISKITGKASKYTIAYMNKFDKLYNEYYAMSKYYFNKTHKVPIIDLIINLLKQIFNK